MLWDNNEIQFARLICELVAAVDNLEPELVCASMNLEPNELEELFERADSVWEDSKAEITTA